MAKKRVERKEFVAGNRLKTVMRKRMRPIWWMSNITGFSQDKIRKWINNEEQPNLSEAYFLSKVLRCSMEDLVARKFFINSKSHRKTR